MNVRDKTQLTLILVVSLGLTVALLSFTNYLTAQENQSIKIDGSSTVYPITQKIVEDYQQNKKQPVEIKVNFSGTGGGFDKFCRGETEINNASRPIQLAEIELL